MKYWLLLSLWFPLHGLDLTIQSGKEESEPYSILNLRDDSPFGCRTDRDDFNEITQIVCQIPKPSQRTFSPINNTHFTVQQTKTSSGTAITIKPKTKIALYPVSFDLVKNPQMYVSNTLSSKQWTLIGYRKKIPMLSSEKQNPNALNLPVKIIKDKDPYPYVGGLDLKGNPIAMKRVQDVNDYMELKKAYQGKDYAKVLFLAQSTLKNYPDTIFKNELLLYQIRALHHLGESEKLLELSKKFIRQYSGDSGIAEVLAYTGNAYSKIGQNINSDYFYDRLFTEHGSSPFAAQGMFYKAQQLEVMGSFKKAAKFYREALNRTKDVDLASAASFKLAHIEMMAGHPEKAKPHLEKIAQVNPKYFSDVRPDAVKMINTFIEKKDPKTAAKITKSLMDAAPKKSAEHEVLLKNLGLLYAAAGQKEKALDRFNEYINLFPYGEGLDEVRRAKDGLFFEKTELTGSEGIKKYDELIERYGNDSVGQKALYKKAQLLLKEKKYQEILDMENDLYRLNSKEFPEANSMIAQSAIALTKQKLEAQKCSEAMTLHRMYRIKLLPQWDGLTFDCALRMGNFPVAKKIAAAHVKSPTIAERQVWLLRLTKAHFEMGEYKQATRTGKDLVTLLQVQKNPPLNEVYRVLFDTAQRMGNDEGMVQYIKGCESAYGIAFADIERYTQMAALGLKRKDDAMIQNYAQKVTALQGRTKTYTQSPFIEFTLAQSLMNQDKNKEALQILKSLDGRKLTAEKRSRQKYLVGSLEMTMGRIKEAKAAFDASIKANKGSAWGKLAKDALGLL